MNEHVFPIPYLIITLLPATWFLVRLFLQASEEKKKVNPHPARAIFYHLGVDVHILSFNMVIATMFMPFVQENVCAYMGGFVILCSVAAAGTAASQTAGWYIPSFMVGAFFWLVSLYLVLAAYGLVGL